MELPSGGQPGETAQGRGSGDRDELGDKAGHFWSRHCEVFPCVGVQRLWEHGKMGWWDLPVVLRRVPSQAGRAEGVQPGEGKGPGRFESPFQGLKGILES